MQFVFQLRKSGGAVENHACIAAWVLEFSTLRSACAVLIVLIMQGYVRSCHVGISILISVAACAGAQSERPQPPGSRGPRASDHLAKAREHEESARQRILYPDTRPDATGRVDQLLVGHVRWDSAADHDRAAAHHRSEAGALYAEYEQACGDHAVVVSPIVRYAIGGTATSTGVVLYLTPEAGSAERLIAELRCHRAWMMLAPANMDTCPLDIAGLSLDAYGENEGFTLTLSVRDPALVPELQRRVARDLELGRR